MRCTAQEVYNKLKNGEVFESSGQIKFCFCDIDIIVRQKDVVGNIIQEWLKSWFDKIGIDYALSKNTQTPPDFYLNPDNREEDLLEVKAFNHSAGPAFDIANYRMYMDELIKKPYMLNADYLIFGYDMSNDGIVTVKDLWIKKVWEITRPMKNGSLNLQVKKGTIYNIRPGVWYKESTRIIPMFACLEDFISALDNTAREIGEILNWKKCFSESYKDYYVKPLKIPKWEEISYKYR